MHVYDIKVSFMRRIQVREYEPVEVTVGAAAQLAEGENVETSIKALLTTASEQTHMALGLAPSAKIVPKGHVEVAATVARSMPNGGTETKTVQVPVKQPAPAAPAKTTPVASAKDDIPGEDPAPKAAAAAETPAKTAPVVTAKADDIPGEDPAPASTADTHKTLSDWVGDLVRNGKLLGATVKSVYPEFQVQRILDLKPEQFPKFRAKIEGLLAAAASAADL